MDKWAAITITLTIILPLSWILYLYNTLASLVDPRLVAEYRVSYALFIPVVADTASIVSISTGLILAAAPLHFYARKHVRLAEQIEDQAVDFLAVFATILSSTRSVYEALIVASELTGKPLSNTIRYIAYTYKATGDLQEAFDSATGSLPRRVRVFFKPVATILRSGGSPQVPLATTVAHMREIRRLSRLVRSRLGEYTFTVLLSSLTFAASAGVMIGILYYMARLELPVVGKLAVDVGLIRGLYFYALVIINLASSIVLARIVQGYTLLAPKYFIILTLATLPVFTLSPRLVGALP